MEREAAAVSYSSSSPSSSSPSSSVSPEDLLQALLSEAPIPETPAGGKYRIDQYVFLRKLGHGKFSTVYKAKHMESGEYVAVKVMDLGYMKDHGMEKQMLREMAITKKMRHPNVVTLHEVLYTEDKLFLVLDLATEGELLARILRSKFFDEQLGRHYFHHLIAGIRYCHSLGVAHRDLKPENLLLFSGNVLKISDFGLSVVQRVDEGGSLLTTNIGTPHYTAPEVFRRPAGIGYDGFKADIWSAGIVLYAMLCGRLPFRGGNPRELMQDILTSPVLFPAGFPPQVKPLLRKMLTKDPAARASLDDIEMDPWFSEDWEPVPGDHFSVSNVSAEEMNSAVSPGVAGEVFGSCYDSSGSLEQVTEEEDPSLLAPKEVAKDMKPLSAFEVAHLFAGCEKSSLIGELPSQRRSCAKFLALGDADGLLEEIKEMVEEHGSMHCAFRKNAEGTLLLKVFQTFPVLLFNVQVVPTIKEGLVLATFRRELGDRLLFNQVYRCLYNIFNASHSSPNHRPSKCTWSDDAQEADSDRSS